MTTVQIFQKMFDYLVAHKVIRNQTELARAAGVNEVTVSRILNGNVHKAKQETLWRVNTAFGNVFNPEWLRGKSDVMLADDEKAQCNAGATDTPASSQDNTPDMSSLINAALAAKDETIASLKREIAAKDDLLSSLRDHVSDKDNLIADKERYILDLQQQIRTLISHYQQESPQKDHSIGYAFPMGLAEREKHPNP